MNSLSRASGPSKIMPRRPNDAKTSLQEFVTLPSPDFPFFQVFQSFTFCYGLPYNCDVPIPAGAIGSGSIHAFPGALTGNGLELVGHVPFSC